MIDQEKLQRVKVGVKTNPVDALNTMSTEELRALRDAINVLLPPETLSSMNLEHELVSQYRKVQELQQAVLNDDGIAANQRSQVAGQVASTLQQLIKMQTEFHTAERFKAIENLMIHYMKKLPVDVAEAFINEYERLE